MDDLIFIFSCALAILGPGISMCRLTYYTDERVFSKLVNTSSKFSYTEWDQQCRDLGDGWAPVVINSVVKYKFIRENQRRLSSSRSFYIGGTTNAGSGQELEYFEYRPNSTGFSRVHISTFLPVFYDPYWFDDYIYRMVAARESFGTNSILCETAQNMTYWMEKCSEIGSGWIPVIINSVTEYNAIVENQRILSNNQSYWVFGSTRATGAIGFSNYLPLPHQTRDDLRPVYVSTEDSSGMPNNDHFQLTTGNETLLLQGVLCENDGLLYESETGRYRKLVSRLTFNYEYWSQMCSELGAGWGPAVADNVTELEFFQDQERISTDDRSYWIGGLTHDTVESRGYSADTHAWLLSTWRSGRGYTDETSIPTIWPKSLRTFGILCE